MLKILIFIILLAGSSFFITDVFSLEIEFQKESERIKESLGWIDPERASYNEQIQLIIDHRDSKNKINVSLLSKNPNDIRFPDYIENIARESKIVSFMITNQFGCALHKIEDACIIIDVERSGLGDNIRDIKENTRKITDNVIGGGTLVYSPEFDSVTLQKKTNLDGEEKIVSRALYLINKQSTGTMFSALTNMVLSSDVKTSGGFYDHAKELSKNNFSSFHLSFIPLSDSVLRSIQISLICSDKHPEFVRCPENVTEDIANGKISPLDFIQVENISRSKIFDDSFFPLNSIIQVAVFSDQDLQVKTVNTNLIETLQDVGDVQDHGWFFSKSNAKIDGRYMFGAQTSVSKNDLVFLFGTNTGTPIEVKDGGGCLIATAAFGSELAPQVQFLREIRDNTVLQTEYGTSFMTGFNQFYYSFSPAIADYERENPAFKEVVKTTLTPLLTSLALLNYVDIDSEYDMLGYGIGIILLNIGMYFVAPAILIMKIRKRVNIEKLSEPHA